MIHGIPDVTLRRTLALPAADASANSTSVDLRGARASAVGANLEARFSIPALPALVEDKTVTVTFEDSADDSSFAAVPELPTLVVTGGAGNGAAKTDLHFYLPPRLRRYLRYSIAVEDLGGNNTGVSAQLDCSLA